MTYNKSDVSQTGLEYPKILNKRNKIDVVPNTIKTIQTHVYLSFRETLANEWTPKAVCESCADWLKFEDLSNRDLQVAVGHTQEGQEKRKLQLVRKETYPGAMFNNFKKLLHEFSSHQFRASRQSKQMKDCIDHLPLEHACCIHNYSKNYSCTSQDQLQSQYFSQSQASIHVTILHRHALKDIDRVESTIEDPLSSPNTSH